MQAGGHRFDPGTLHDAEEPLVPPRVPHLASVCACAPWAEPPPRCVILVLSYRRAAEAEAPAQAVIGRLWREIGRGCCGLL